MHMDLKRLALDIIGESAFGYQFKSVLGGDTEVIIINNNNNNNFINVSKL